MRKNSSCMAFVIIFWAFLEAKENMISNKTAKINSD